MAVQPFSRQEPVVAGYAVGFVIGGAVTIAGALSRWMTRAVVSDNAGIDFGEGRIILSLGIIAVLLGVVAVFNHAASVEILVAATGCALAAAVLSLAVAEIHEIQSYQNILAYIIPTVGEGLWVTVAGGSIVGLSSLTALGRGIARLTREYYP